MSEHSTTVTLVCSDSQHPEWTTTATEGGMARPVPSEQPGACQPVSFEQDRCRICGQKGTLKH
jgi:hypothetical protein